MTTFKSHLSGSFICSAESCSGTNPNCTNKIFNILFDCELKRRLLFETRSGCLPNQDSNTNSAMKWKFRYMDDWLRVSIDVCLRRSATCTHSCVQLHRLKSCSLGGINAPGSLVLINITMKMFPVLWSPSGTCACQDMSPLFKVTSTSSF